MTKPGNSDPVEPTADKAAEPTDPAPEPEQTTAGAEPAPEAESAEPEPAAEKPAEAKPAAKPTTEPEPAVKPAVEPEPAAKAREVEDAEPLMAELEKAPPPPREETIRARSTRASSTRAVDEAPPRTLRYSFYFFAAAGLVWVLNGVLFLINKQSIVNAQVEANDRTDITADQLASAVNQLLWFYVVIAVVFAAFLGLFGWKATEGNRRARTLVTIFSAILVIFHLLLFSTQIGVLSALLALIGLALIWSPSARAHFPRRQQLS